MTSGTWKPVPFSFLDYNPEIGVEFDIFSWEVTDTGDTGNDRYEVTSLVKGWYEWELFTAWDAVGTAGTLATGYAVQRLTWTVDTGFPYQQDYRASADWPNTGNFEMKDNAFLHDSGRILVPASKVWRPEARQVTGVNRGLTGEMRITYIEADTQSDWTFLGPA